MRGFQRLFLAATLASAAACSATTEATDAATHDASAQDTPLADITATDGGCGALANTAPAATDTCPSGNQCPECTGTNLTDGLYFMTSTEVFASACGALTVHGTLRLSNGTIETVTAIPASLATDPPEDITRTLANYTVQGNVLHLSTLCPSEPVEDITFGTSPAGRLQIVNPPDGGIASVYQRQ